MFYNIKLQLIQIMRPNVKLNLNIAFIIIFIITTANAFDFQQLRVTSTALTTNIISSYTIVFNRAQTNLFSSTAFATTPLNQTSTLTLTFPVQFVITSGITCSYQLNSTGTYLNNACVLNNNQIIFSNIFSNNSIIRSVSVIISNVLNPFPAGRTLPFTGTIGNDVAVVNGANGINSFVTITAALCTSSFTFVDNLVSSNENMIIKLTLKNILPLGATIGVQFPLTRRWSNELNPLRQIPIVVTMVCRRISLNLKSVIQCSGSSSVGTLVTVSSLSDSTLAAGTQISFSIDNLFSPPTNQPIDSLNITTYTGSNSIDSCLSRVEGLIPKTIPSSQFIISETDNIPMIVNQQYTIKFDFTTLDYISQSDSILITFPTGVTINNFASSQVGGTLGIDPGNSNFYNSQLTLKLDGINSLEPGQFFITVSNFVAPPNVLTTNNFFLQIVSNGFPRMNSYQSITAVTGAVSGSVVMVNTVVNSVTRYTFTIRISNLITSSGKIIITFPSILSLIVSNKCAILSGTSISSSPDCTYNSVQNSITFTNLNISTNNIPAQTMILSINSIQNPPSTRKTGGFLVQTFYTQSDSMMVDSGSIDGVTATIGAIDHSKIKISSTNLVTSATGVTYSFQFLTTHGISAGGSVTINLPRTIVIDIATATNNCNININNGISTTTPCVFTQTASSYVARFTNPFPINSVDNNTTVKFSILNAVTNPISTQSVSPFYISTFQSSGSSIAETSNSLSYSVTIPSSLLSHTFQRLSNKNAEITTYTITLSQIVSLPPNSIIYLQFPSSILAQSSSACTMNYLGTSISVACSLTGNTFKIISFNNIIPAGIPFSLSFTNIRNPYSFAPLTGFQATTKTSNDAHFYSRGPNTNILSNTIPTAFNMISYTYAPQQLSSSLSLTIIFQLSQFIVMPQYLLISIDPYFTVGTLSCNSFVDFSGFCTNQINNTIRVTGVFNNSVMGLTISGFSTPNAPPSVITYSTLGSFDSNNYKIDESTNNISFSLNCNLPCKTCSVSNKSSCSSCYSSVLITSSIFYHGSSAKCYVNCPDTTYNNNVTLLCTACDSNCLHCYEVPTFCTKCKPNSTFPYLNISGVSQVCVSSCVSTMYPDTSIDPSSCVACKSPCLTCTTQVLCITCRPGFFYLGNNSCLTQCPADFTIQNSVTNVCQYCTGICRTCSGNLNTCTSCNSPLVYYNGSCQSQCPSGGTLAPFNGICTPCIAQCLTCSASINNCTSCNSSSNFIYLVINSCIQKCPIFFYNQTSTQSCISCASANINCVNCSSASTCYTCDNSFVLFENRCLNYVPSGYVNISGIAVACSGDCETCSITATNCTKCKTLNLQANLCVSTCQLNSIPISKVCSQCLYPCLTCSLLLFNCTSCVTNADPSVYLSGNSCQNTCPDYTYSNKANFRCTSCINNCLLCTSATICLSCTNNTFLMNSTCLSSCPSGMTGINSFCQFCTNNCRTCSGATNICISCLNGTYLINSSCVTNCGSGLYIDYISQTCIGCTSPCHTCSSTTSTCTSCTTGYLINNKCQLQCPSAMYPLVGKCQNCAQNCSACTSATNCSRCSGTWKLYNFFCVQNCPETDAFVSNGACIKCSTQNCYSCTSANVCLSCVSGFLLLKGICLTTCPSGYSSNGTNCNLDTLNAILQDKSNSFPVPFTIAGVVMIIACLMSRLQFNQTYLSGAIYSLIGILQIAALLVFLGIYYMDYNSQPVPLLIGIAATLFLYLLNIIATITQSLFLKSEKQFQDWNSAKCNTIFYYFTNFLSLCICHKFKNILFCKLFTFKVFSAKLNKIQNFRIFNIFSLVSLMHSGGALFAAGIALGKIDEKRQIYQQCIDVLVLTSLNIAMAFFNTHKQKDFFLEMTPQGYSLHKKNNMIEEHLVGGMNMNDVGNDIQVEKGYINVHSHALSSQQALQFGKDSQVGSYDEYSDTSLAAISEKHYEEISVQAQDIITQKMNITGQTGKQDKTKNISYEEISIQADELLNATQPHKGIDLSQLPPQGFQHDSSNFTAYDFFKKVDKSIQGYPSRANYSVQMNPQQQDLSFQYDKPNNKVDCSVQKYPTNSKIDMSIQPSRRSLKDQSIYVAQSNRSYGIQQKPSFSNKNIFIQAEMEDAQNQISEISQEDEQIQFQALTQQQGIQPDIEYNEIAVQPTLDPSQQQIGIQYEREVNFNEFQQQIQQSNTESNVLYDQQQQIEAEQQRQLQAQKVQQLQLQNDNVRSHQQQLQQRIRNKEKQLEEMKRKVQFKMRLNEKRRESLINNKHISQQNIPLGSIYYIQQRPDVNPSRRQQSQSQRSQTTNRQQSLYNKESQAEFNKTKQPHIKTQKSQKNNYQAINFRKHTQKSQKQSQKLQYLRSKGNPSKSKQPQLQQNLFINNNKLNNSNNQQNISHIQDNTIEEIKILNDSKEQSLNKVQREKTIEQIRQEDIKHDKKNELANEIKSQTIFKKNHQRHIEFNEIDNELISQDSLGNEILSGSNLNSKRSGKLQKTKKDVKPQSQPLKNESKRQQIKKRQQKQQKTKVQFKQQQMNNEVFKEQKFKFIDHKDEILNDQGNNSSVLTKKIKQIKKNIVVDVDSIDRSFSGKQVQQGEEMIQLEEGSQSDKEPTGIINHYYHEKPSFRDRSPSSMSGTIEEIPKNYSKVDHDKTINNHLQKTQKLNNNPAQTKPNSNAPQTKIQKQQLTNYFAGNLPKSNNLKSKNQIPQDKDVQKFRINKLYSNNEIKTNKNEDKIPSNIHNRQKGNSTFAMAAQNQLNDHSMQRKQPNNNYPLNTQKFQWEAQQEDKYISEDDEFSKKNNRNNLVKNPNKNLSNFASHLVLPQESDKQDTSFHHLAKKQELKAPQTGKQRQHMKRPQVEQIQVHFQSQQTQNEISHKMHNESPGIPRAFQTNRLTSNGQNSLYEQESQDLDYKQQMILQQMQKRPDNDDLQEYYQKKTGMRNSKEKRRKSNSKLQRSTEKIYMQKLDRYKK